MILRNLLRRLQHNTQTDLIKSAYSILLGREPDQEGLRHWMDLLDGGWTSEQFLSAIVDSDEFQNAPPPWLKMNLWRKCQSLHADICLPLDIGEFIAPTANAPGVESMLHHDGVYEPHVTAEIQRCLKPGDTFVDLGANLGYFSLLASGLVGPSGKVIAFEPHPVAFEYLQKNARQNKLSNVELYKKGIWNEHTTLHISNTQRLDTNFITKEGEEIECVPLDSLNLTPDLIKMDIEGAEPFALRGMKKTMHHRPPILMEINRFCLRNFFGLDAKDIWQIVSSLGYDIYMIPWKGEKIKIESEAQLNTVCPIDGWIDTLCTHENFV